MNLLDLETHLRLVGGSLIALGLAHFLFPRRFGWREELDRLSLLTRQIFWVHTYFIVLTLVLFGSLALFWPETLLEPTPLARLVLGGQAIFWGFRLYCQHGVFRAELWRGKPFNTVVHVLFTLLWVYYTGVYAAACLAVSMR